MSQYAIKTLNSSREHLMKHLVCKDPRAVPSPHTTRGRRKKRGLLCEMEDGPLRSASSATPDPAQKWRTGTCQNTWR